MAVPTLVLVLVLLASYQPALAATKINPLDALPTE
jgi:hypothetical protein